MTQTDDRHDETGQWQGSGRRRIRHPWVALALTVLAVLAAFVVADRVTGSAAFCGSCHAMKTRADSWSHSEHVTVSCVSCHEPPRSWYGSPAGVAERARLLVRDFGWQLGGRPEGASTDDGSAVTDANCLVCHDPARRATSGFRILIDHEEHAARNGSCVSCHINTAHPRGGGSALTLMEQCFTCHGTPEKPKASAECEACHPKGYELRPSTHARSGWTRTHGKTALAGPKQCSMCHTAASCTDCHGLKMPHPTGWSRGKAGHAAYAQRDRAICAKCHEDKPDLCSMCHHRTYDPSKGTWVKQHFIAVRDRGASYCLDCHAPIFCVECHVR